MKLLTLILSLFIVYKGQSQISLAVLHNRTEQNLDGKWQTIIDWYNNGNANEISINKLPTKKDEFMEFSFDNSQTLNVPGDWNSQKDELKYYEGTMWYKRDFQATKKTDKIYVLKFGAVSYMCDVYLNGQKVGTHEGSFDSFSFDVTKYLKEGNNILVLKVNNERKIDNIPAMKFDWWNYGGITRSVSIVELPTDPISDYFLQLKKGSLDIVHGWIKTVPNSSVEVNIADANFKKTFNTNSEGIANIEFKKQLDLWSPHHPKLYQVKLTTANDTLIDDIGFRSIEVVGNNILLNKKSIFLKGISFHEEMPSRVGRATSVSDSKVLLDWAKELGCNFIRLAHYTQNEETVRLAEKMGFMLWEEIPVWQGIQFENPVISQKMNHMLTEMVSRDKNRAGIIIWSISNETTPSAARDSSLVVLSNRARVLDPTRLISSAYDHFKNKGDSIFIYDTLSKHLDLIAINKYMGWYHKWPSQPGNVTWVSPFNKPIIVSEFGGEAEYGVHGSKDSAASWSEEYQEQLYKDNLSMFLKIPDLRGVSPWVLADFRTPFRMQAEHQQGWNRKGLLSDKGYKKKAWYLMHDFYKQVDKKYEAN